MRLVFIFLLITIFSNSVYSKQPAGSQLGEYADIGNNSELDMFASNTPVVDQVLLKKFVKIIQELKDQSLETKSEDIDVGIEYYITLQHDLYFRVEEQLSLRLDEINRELVIEIKFVLVLSLMLFDNVPDNFFSRVVRENIFDIYNVYVLGHAYDGVLSDFEKELDKIILDSEIYKFTMELNHLQGPRE